MRRDFQKEWGHKENKKAPAPAFIVGTVVLFANDESVRDAGGVAGANATSHLADRETGMHMQVWARGHLDTRSLTFTSKTVLWIIILDVRYQFVERFISKVCIEHWIWHHEL